MKSNPKYRRDIVKMYSSLKSHKQTFSGIAVLMKTEKRQFESMKNDEISGDMNSATERTSGIIEKFLFDYENIVSTTNKALNIIDEILQEKD